MFRKIIDWYRRNTSEFQIGAKFAEDKLKEDIRNEAWLEGILDQARKGKYFSNYHKGIEWALWENR